VLSWLRRIHRASFSDSHIYICIYIYIFHVAYSEMPSVPDIYRDPLLVVLEGDRQAPANHAKKRRGVNIVASA